MHTKLGQNFLKNENVVKKIVEAANLTAHDLVLEIGPGKGVLTEKLARKARKVLAVEIDRNLVEILKNKFENFEKAEIINEDILKVNLIDIINSNNPKQQSTGYKVVANLPYYITSPIIRFFLEAEIKPSEMILMVQKEVAERIVAKPGEMSILAVSVQYYAKPELLFTVPKEDFDPIPEVDSAVLKISNIENQKSKIEVNKFFRVVRAGFCARRKTLANNISNSFHLDKNEVEEKIKTAGLTPTVRAQELSIENWKKLAEIF